ncbi:exonuclease domain-containing protein [Vibrio renipiscarius]|uniref:3'-5' exonuclease n=1 Tax=Vibrio renipiscarius TaxID=1461322 RepID=UPI00354EA728
MKRLLRYFHPYERINRKRSHYVSSTILPNALRSLLTQPIVEHHIKAKDRSFVVFDLETTGLNCEDDLILSIGWVVINNGVIDLASSQHLYINTDSQIKPETAVINHIVPQMLTDGITIHDAMAAFFAIAEDKCIVAHGCMIEENFINQYLLRAYGISPPPLIWFDTLNIEKNLNNIINKQNQCSVTLSDTRSRYGLPEYNGHNALVDAVATAELLLAQMKRIAPNGDTTISSLYRLSI